VEGKGKCKYEETGTEFSPALVVKSLWAKSLQTKKTCKKRYGVKKKEEKNGRGRKRKGGAGGGATVLLHTT